MDYESVLWQILVDQKSSVNVFARRPKTLIDKLSFWPWHKLTNQNTCTTSTIEIVGLCGSQMIGSILSVGHSPELLKARSLLLCSMDLSVVQETDCERALQVALRDDIDLVLLCHSLKKCETNFLIAALAEKRRLLPVLVICKNDFMNVPRGCESVASSPDILLRQVRGFLQNGAAAQTGLDS